MRRTQKVETRGCNFISEIREGLSDNVTLYRLLKESCEYLGEHSRKREGRRSGGTRGGIGGPGGLAGIHLCGEAGQIFF